jgi:hypothetical protein
VVQFSRLLDGLAVLLVAVVIGRVLWPKRRSYFIGVRLIVIAYVLETLWAIINPATFKLPWWIGLVWFAPILEESLRIGALHRERFSLPTDWLFLGLGFAIFEAVLKLLQIAFALSRDAMLPTALLFTVTVPFMLHVGLSVLGGALVSRAWPAPVVFVSTTTLHLLNNWRAYEITQQTVASNVFSMMIIQGAVVASISAAVLLAFVRVTTPPQHGNTPP